MTAPEKSHAKPPLNSPFSAFAVTVKLTSPFCTARSARASLPDTTVARVEWNVIPRIGMPSIADTL